MKVHQELEQIFKFRLNNKASIGGYMQRVTQMGKFDQPKNNAIQVMLLKRVADLEDIIEQLQIELGYLKQESIQLHGGSFGGGGSSAEMAAEVSPQGSTSASVSADVDTTPPTLDTIEVEDIADVIDGETGKKIGEVTSTPIVK